VPILHPIGYSLAHTDNILRELGYAAEEIERMRGVNNMSTKSPALRLEGQLLMVVDVDY
jgi:hypothetical protein